jgi:hypothetical protein
MRSGGGEASYIRAKESLRFQIKASSGRSLCRMYNDRIDDRSLSLHDQLYWRVASLFSPLSGCRANAQRYVPWAFRSNIPLSMRERD